MVPLTDRISLRPPHLSSGRRIHRGQYIHASLRDYMRDTNHQNYTPAGVLPQGLSWDDLRRDSPEQSWLLVTDPYSSAKDLMNDLAGIVRSMGILARKHTDPLSGLLLTCEQRYFTKQANVKFVLSAAGRQSIIDVPDAADILFRALEYLHESTSQGEVIEDKVLQSRINAVFVAALSVFPSLPRGSVRRPNSKVRPLLSNVSEEDCNRILNVFGFGKYSSVSKIINSGLICTLQGHCPHCQVTPTEYFLSHTPPMASSLRQGQTTAPSVSGTQRPDDRWASRSVDTKIRSTPSRSRLTADASPQAGKTGRSEYGAGRHDQRWRRHSPDIKTTCVRSRSPRMGGMSCLARTT